MPSQKCSVRQCGAHLYHDDLGAQPRCQTVSMHIYKGLPAAGVGWRGGSKVLPAGAPCPNPDYYEPLPESVVVLTLDEAVCAACALSGSSEVDFMKMDCEGCELFAIGCASQSTLKRIRFIGGEYHDIERFYEVMVAKLYRSHYVNLIGNAAIGSFFCERKGATRTILEPSREGMLQSRPWLTKKPIDWHVFRDEFVLAEERPMHALP